jgi:hypothetical protein
MKTTIAATILLLSLSCRAAAAPLIPTSGQSLSSGSHLKMHQVVTVDSGSPTSSVSVGSDGKLDAVYGLKIGGTEITPGELEGGDVVGPATHAASYVPQWNTIANSKTLEEGFPVTSFAKTLVDDADSLTALSTLGAQAALPSGPSRPVGSAIGETRWQS